jgi:hypothetical protein
MTAEGVGLAYTRNHIETAPELAVKKELDDQEEERRSPTTTSPTRRPTPARPAAVAGMR